MAWLDRINDRDTRRLARRVRAAALETGELAQDYAGMFANQAGGLATRAARQAAHYGRHEGSALAEQAGNLATNYATDFAHRAGDIAGRAARQIADYGRHEGAALAREATATAVRTSRAVKADPLPMVVGLVGAALLANLLLGRRG